MERRLGWLPATLNVGAAQANSVAPLFRDDLPASVREFQPLVSALDRLPLAQRLAGRDRLNQLLECPDDQRIAVEGGLQRVASVIVMHELFSMA